MTIFEMFGAAKWVSAGIYQDGNPRTLDAGGLPNFPILRSCFSVTGVKRASLRVVGLGFFECYINGNRVSSDFYLPHSTDYEPRGNTPKDEMLTGHRLYVPEYDISDMLQDGENVIALHFGGGWYTYEYAYYGAPKAIYRIMVEDEAGEHDFVSSADDKIGDSFIKTYCLTTHECHDYRGFDDAAFGRGFDDTLWSNAVEVEPLDTDYLFTDCPTDRLCESITPTLISCDSDGARIYDVGKEITGFPILKISSPAGESVSVFMAEELLEDGSIDYKRYGWGQHFSVVSDGKERIAHSHFTWYAFRYFRVEGDAEVLSVAFVHSDVSVNSEFCSGNATLDWLYDAFVNTQLCNMHAGIPSDCPHIERKGYTGDGELCAHAAMTMLDAMAFYRKWIEDIADCQDSVSGHVQYTAPYVDAGGGPGAWGCAIVEVPYEYYKQYGDIEPAKRLYPQMLKYFDFLEEHSDFKLVTSDMPGKWCLGDWCAVKRIAIPAPLVNNYYYAKSLKRVIEIAGKIGMDGDIPMLEARLAERQAATKAAYLNIFDQNYVGNVQGANAFAVDMGIDMPKTYGNFVVYCQEAGAFDTGICATNLIANLLFERGDGEVALDLLLSKAETSFEGMRKRGATTLWENWPLSHWERSHNHPMFGAASSVIFDYLLGIRQPDDSAGFEKVLIAPHFSPRLPSIRGKRTIPSGEVSVNYTQSEGVVNVEIFIPDGVDATFAYSGKERCLNAGRNSFVIQLA